VRLDRFGPRQPTNPPVAFTRVLGGGADSALWLACMDLDIGLTVGGWCSRMVSHVWLSRMSQLGKAGSGKAKPPPNGDGIRIVLQPLEDCLPSMWNRMGQLEPTTHAKRSNYRVNTP
jgi:hypothetical protein